jgi:high-affinity nickel-transport protein
VLTAALLGFALGLRHAFDPDHVAAISTILARHRDPRRAAWIGVSWGLGHGATVLAAGAVVIALRIAVPPQLALALEIPVALLLIGLGAANLLAAGRGSSRRGAAPAADLPLRGALARSGLLGLAHGLAGSAAIALLALAAMPTPGAAFAYLALFGLGTIAGMGVFSFGMSAPLARLSPSAGAERLVIAATGLVSLLVGSWLLYEISMGGALEAVA